MTPDPEPADKRAIEDVVIGALNEFIQQLPRIVMERLQAQGKVLDARFAAHLRMMQRLEQGTRSAVQQLEERLARVEAALDGQGCADASSSGSGDGGDLSRQQAMGLGVADRLDGALGGEAKGADKPVDHIGH